ncbi:MAG: type II secretion system protein GspL [Planctomycetota bacterium]
MARSSALRIGPRRFELVVLDGSAKRHKISAYHVGEFDAADAAAFAEGDVAGVASALKEAAKSHRIPSDNVSVVMATDHAAFRRVTLPFTERAKIDQVLRYEIEGELPQFDIDEVVVDYHIMSENEQGAELLVSAVPKEDVQTVIAACEKAGIEPLEIELEGTAIVNAAFAADMCHIDDAQLLVHVGEHSTSVAVVAGGELREFRVIHIGAMTHLAHELDDAQSGLDEDAEGDGEGDEATRASDPAQIERRVEQAVKRIKRELGRTISAARTAQPIEAIHVAGTELPGLVGSEVLGVPVYVLDCFEEDSGQPADGFGQLVASYGGAVRQLGGGPLKPSLRREELRYTGTWERLEFPVAFAALMLATFLGMLNIIQHKRITFIESQMILPRLKFSNLYVFGSAAKPDSPPIMKRDVPPELFARSEAYYTAARPSDIPEDLPPPIDEFDNVKRAIQQEVLKLEEEYGTTRNVTYPPSAFTALTLVVDKLRSNPEWRPSLRQVDAGYEKEGRDGTPEHITVKLDVVFFASDTVEASRHLDEWRSALRAEPWCIEIEEVAAEALPDSTGVYLSRLPIHVDPGRARELQ